MKDVNRVFQVGTLDAQGGFALRSGVGRDSAEGLMADRSFTGIEAQSRAEKLIAVDMRASTLAVAHLDESRSTGAESFETRIAPMKFFQVGRVTQGIASQ